LAGNRHCPKGANMATIPTREELLSILNQKYEEFTEQLIKRMEGKELIPSMRFQGKMRPDGEIYVDSESFKEPILQLMARAAYTGILAFIDTLSESTSSSDMQSDIKSLDQRLAKLEWRLSQILSPDWPTTIEPNDMGN